MFFFLLFFVTDGEEMECNFDEVHTQGLIITKYHSIDLQKRSSINSIPYLSYGSDQILATLVRSSKNCYQTYDILCHPWIQEIYDIDTQGSSKQNSKCFCVRVNFTMVPLAKIKLVPFSCQYVFRIPIDPVKQNKLAKIPFIFLPSNLT